jgi:hypothetical protein
MTVTYDPKKAGAQLLPGAMYMREYPDGTQEWFSVASKRRNPNGAHEYVIITCTFGREHLKDTHQNYKNLREQCVRWDPVAQKPIPEGDDVKEDISLQPVADDGGFQLEL